MSRKREIRACIAEGRGGGESGFMWVQGKGAVSPGVTEKRFILLISELFVNVCSLM